MAEVFRNFLAGRQLAGQEQQQRNLLAQQGVDNERQNRLLEMDMGRNQLAREQFDLQRQQFDANKQRQQGEYDEAARAEVGEWSTRLLSQNFDDATKVGMARMAVENPAYAERFRRAGIDGAKINWDNPQAVLQGLQSVAGWASPAKSTAPPGSYQEYDLARNDPEYSKFLRERRGKGISITNPDGSVIQIGGDGGAIGPDDLTAPTRNKLQEALVQSADELDRLNSIGQDFDPRFLQIPGRLKAAGLKVKDLAGGLLGELNPEERAYLSRFSSFKANAAKNLSAILNRLSGAAISPAEAVRLKKGIPNDDDSPTEFIAKYFASVKDTTRATMRANWALKNGIGVRSIEQLAQVMPLDAIDQVYEQRANQIWRELGGTPEAKREAMQQADREFGLAR